jgi:predicted PurR-regulated permease PerM
VGGRLREAPVSDAEADRPAPAGEPARAGWRWVPAPRWAVVGIFLLLAIQGIAYARAFLMPVVLAMLLALVFSPLRRALERIGLSSGLSALMIVGTLLGALLLGLFSLSGPVSEWVDNAPTIGWRLEQRLQELRGAAEGALEAAEQVDRLTGGAAEPATAGEDVERVVVDEPGGAVDAALAAPAALAQVLFTLILLFFLLSSGDMFYEKIVHVMPTFGDKRRALQIAYDIERKLSRYFFTITLINAGLGVAIGIAMWLLGMPNPVLFGLAGFLLNYIPYVGAVLGTALAVAVGMISMPSLQMAFVPGVVFFLLTSIEGQFVTPYFVGRSLQLNTVVVFLSVTLWAWLWSVVGMLVATPLLVTIRTLCEHIPALEPLGDFLSGRGAERENGDEDG